MNKKQLFYVIVFFIMFLIICCIYIVRTSNMILGSNTYYYRNIYDFPDTVWECKEENVKIMTFDEYNDTYSKFNKDGHEKFAIMKYNDKEFYVEEYYGGIYIYSITMDEYEIPDFTEAFVGHTKYRKNFWTKKVESYTIYDITTDEIFDHKYKKLSFKRK